MTNNQTRKGETMNVTITYECNNVGHGVLIARDDDGQIVDHLPFADPIDAGSDSWDIAAKVLGDRRILSVDHDKDCVMVELED